MSIAEASRHLVEDTPMLCERCQKEFRKTALKLRKWGGPFCPDCDEMELAERRKATQKRAQAKYYLRVKRGLELLEKERQESVQLVDNQWG